MVRQMMLRLLPLSVFLMCCGRSLGPADEGEARVPEQPTANWWLAGQSACPDGAQLMGAAPPQGQEVYCEASNGERMGPYAAWTDRLKTSEGMYRAGQKQGIWFERDPHNPMVPTQPGAASIDEIDLWTADTYPPDAFPPGPWSARGAYANGKRVGLWQFTQEGLDMTITVQGAYRQGVHHGPWTSRYDNGKNHVALQYVDGRSVGSATMWNEDGQKILEIIEIGKTGRVATAWDKRGRISHVFKYEHGKLVSTEDKRVGVEQVYRVTKGEVQTAIDMIVARMDREKLLHDDIRVLRRNDDIVIELLYEQSAQAGAMRRLLAAAPPGLAMRVIDDSADPFLDKLHQHVSADAQAGERGVSAERDTRGSAATGVITNDYFLRTAHTTGDKGRLVLRDYLRDLSAKYPEFRLDGSHLFGYEQTLSFDLHNPTPDFDKPTHYWRTHYLHSKVEMDGTAIESARVVWDPESHRPVVIIDFTASGTAKFAQLTRTNIGNRIAMSVGERVVMAPSFEAEIAGGSVMITIGGANSDDIAREAEALVLAVRLAANPPTLQLTSTGKLPRPASP